MTDAILAAANRADPAAIDRGRQRRVLILLSMASFMVAFDALVVTTALGAMRRDLGASIGTLQWTLNAFNLAFAVLLLAGASLGDRFGRRRVLVLGLGVFVVASALCAIAGDAGSLIAARVLQGAGAAMVMPVAMVLLGVAFPGAQRPKALGTFASITGLALIVGPAAGGAIAQGLDWRWVFWVNVPVGAVLIPWLLRTVPESRGPSAPLDLPGLGLATGAACATAWTLMRGHEARWASAEIALAAGLAVVLVVAFIAWQRVAPAPMIPLRLFGNRAFSRAIATSVFLYAPLYLTLVLLPQFFASQGLDSFAAGVRLLPWTATLFVVAPLAGRGVARFGERTLIRAGLALEAVGLALVALVAGPNTSFAALLVPLVLAGTGLSLAMPATQNVVLGATAPAEMGKASGVFNVFRYLSGVFGVALGVEILSMSMRSSPAAGFADGFRAAIGAGAALALIGACVAAGLPSRLRAPAVSAASAAR